MIFPNYERPDAQRDRSEAERLRLGIDASREAIESARLHPRRVDAGSSWWSPDEWKLVNAKLATLQHPPNLGGLRGPAAAAFAGVYPDLKLPLGGWYIGFTTTPEPFVDEVRATYPFPDRLIPFLARIPVSRLSEIEQEVASAALELSARGMQLLGTEIDIRANRVNVYVDTVARGDLEWSSTRFNGVHLIAGVVPGDG